MLTTLDLFAGIGGFALGLEATGFFRTTCFVENEPYCQAVLQYHWPEVPVLGDIKNVQRSDLPDPNPDVIVGGFPCQPFSHAGKQRAQDDPRHLWPEMFRLIRECRPTWVIGENVAGIIKLGLDEVLSDLESEGYATRTFNIPACAVGAPHIRQRLWIIAHADSQGEPDGAFDGDARQGQLGFDVADTQREGERRRRVPRPGKDTGKNGKGLSGEFGRHREAVADAASIDGQRSIGQGGCTRESEAASGDGGGVVADASSGRQRRSGKGQMEQSGRAETKRTSETLADTDETGCEQQRRSKSAQEEQPSIEHGGSLSDTERPRTRMEKSRDSGQGRKSADTRQSKVLRQEDGACSSEGLAASGDRPEVWWKVEPPVGRVVDGLSNRVPQLRALGNSIIPQIAQEIGNAIKALEK